MSDDDSLLHGERVCLRTAIDYWQKRAEKAEAELARLTPTEDEKAKVARFLKAEPTTGDLNAASWMGGAAALLRKFVLRETT